MVKTAARSVHYQGALDSLCGAYAITNALALCEVKPCKRVFSSCLGALSGRRWPQLLWDGTSFGDLQRMLRPLQGLLARRSIRVRYPFARTVPNSNEQYWQCFDELFAQRGSRVAIVGIRRPHWHWIVAQPVRGGIKFFDSHPAAPAFVKRRSSLYAGERKRGAPWIIDRSEMILFQCRK